MCGISGFISKKFNKDELFKMTHSLKHRGPDTEGYFFDSQKGVGLGHRRLSIIDLSEDANQPMTSHCGRYVMVYNGEIYNYKEIAKKLNEVKWETSSDTEVILAAFSKWKFDFVNELNGMFAIAIYEK
jgi:asparagine synthase (glutamine-hydrolysing)